MAGKKEVLQIYKSLLRESKKFSSYNFREYAQRKIRDTFRENAGVTDSTTQTALIQTARSNLDLIHRQVVISSLYSGPNLVLEKQETS